MNLSSDQQEILRFADAENRKNEGDKGLIFLKKLQGIDKTLTEIKEKPEKDITIPDFPDTISVDNFPEPLKEIEISNLPDVQKVEITNFPEHKEKEQKAPIVNVPAPIVNVETPIVNIDTEGLSQEIKQVDKSLNSILEEAKSHKDFSLDKYVRDGRIKVEVDRTGGGVISSPIVKAIEEVNDTLENLDVTINTSDIEIGAVEIKNSTDDTRATVGANGLYTEVRASALPSGAATETTLQSIAGFNIPKYDEIDVTYPTTSTEVYTYKLASVTKGTITVTYSDAVTKQILTSIVLT